MRVDTCTSQGYLGTCTGRRSDGKSNDCNKIKSLTMIVQGISKCKRVLSRIYNVRVSTYNYCYFPSLESTQLFS